MPEGTRQPDVDLAQRAERLAASLLERAEQIKSTRILVGFDGFVDEIVRVVGTRHGPERFDPLPTIADLARRIAAAAGLSANIELVTERVKPGGNAPIMALALARLGFRVTCIAPLGYPQLHPVFAPLSEAGVDIISLGEPAHTDALEFEDGKIMLGKLDPLRHVTWQRLVEAVGLDALREAAQSARVIAMVNWTMLPFLTDIWQQWERAVPASHALIFVDLADPEKRPPEQLRAGLAALERLGMRQPVYLGLNWREALAVRAAIRGDSSWEALAEGWPADGALQMAEELGPRLYRQHIAGVLVHPTREAAAWRRSAGEGPSERGESARVPGPYTPKPLLTTGAGDNFNAGSAAGLALDFPLPDVLLLGKATSGYYVRHGESPTLPQLADFLGRWSRALAGAGGSL